MLNFDQVPLVSVANEPVKRCKKCGETKRLEEFYADKSTKDGRKRACKGCDRAHSQIPEVKLRVKKYNQERDLRRKLEKTDPVVVAAKKEREKNLVAGLKKCSKCGEVRVLEDFYLDKMSASGRRSECFICNKKRVACYNDEHKTEKNVYHSRYASQHREYIRDYNRKRYQKKKKDPIYRFTTNMRRRILLGLKGESKSKNTEYFLGCTFEEAWGYLIPQFRFPMTRENYGKIWHVDHIRPVCSFDLSDPEQVKACFHYTNLQPLFIEENLRKGGKY